MNTQQATNTKPAFPNKTREADAARAKAEKEAKTKEAKPKKEAKAPKAADTRVVTVKAEKNPKRENSASHIRFGKYRNGMTADAYVAAQPEDQRRNARADLAWDAKHGFISLA